MERQESSLRNHTSQYARLLGLVISADLGLEEHVSNVSATCFRHLRQL